MGVAQSIIQQEKDKTKAIAAQLIQLSQKNGATQAAASLLVNQGFDITVRMGDVETLTYHNSKAIGLSVYFGQKKATVSGTASDEQALKEMVEKACFIARHTQEDSCHGLADAALMASDIPDLDLYHPWDITPEQAINAAIAAEKQALMIDPRIKQSEGLDMASVQSCAVYANSHGFIGQKFATRHSHSCTLIAEQDNHMERDYDYSVARDPDDLLSIDRIANNAARKTIERLSPRKLTTCRVPVIFAARVAGGLINHFLSAISGDNLYKKSSFLLDQLNQVVFAPHITIDERPHLLKGLRSSAYDSEGVATKERAIVANGVLRHYLLNSYSARKLDQQTTANAGGARNVFISHSDHDLAALIKKMDKGLLVTDLMGQGISILTGDYSRGASGFWIEHGEIQYPVTELTIAANLKAMFANLVDVANDIDDNGNIHTGSILLESMTVAAG
ncbi:MAG: metalloprotease PmbA [Pseudomonadota bacterium]